MGAPKLVVSGTIEMRRGRGWAREAVTGRASVSAKPTMAPLVPGPAMFALARKLGATSHWVSLTFSID